MGRVACCCSRSPRACTCEVVPTVDGTPPPPPGSLSGAWGSVAQVPLGRVYCGVASREDDLLGAGMPPSPDCLPCCRLLADLPPESGRVLRRVLLATASAQFEAGAPACRHCACAVCQIRIKLLGQYSSRPIALLPPKPCPARLLPPKCLPTLARSAAAAAPCRPGRWHPAGHLHAAVRALPGRLHPRDSHSRLPGTAALGCEPLSNSQCCASDVGLNNSLQNWHSYKY
jgi:hypothetical protein